MFAHQRKRVALLFAVADALLTLLAFETAYVTRTSLSLDNVFFLHKGPHLFLALLSALIWVLLGSGQRVYEHLDSAHIGRLIIRTLRQCLLGVIALVLLQYLIRLDPPLSRSFTVLFFGFACLFLAVFRGFAPTLIGAFQRGFGIPYHVVLVGDSERTSKLEHQLLDGSPFRIQITAKITAESAGLEIPGFLARSIVDEVIFAVPSDSLSALESVLLHCDEEGVRTRVAVDFFPHVNSEITLDRLGEAPLLTFSAAPVDELSLFTKRLIDVLASSLALIVLAPMFAVIAVLIRLTSPGPVIYKQLRCGLNGRTFIMYKFRSMVQNADALRERLEHLNEKQIAFKLANDPRVTSVGRFLRRYSLDEFPQFWNVLKGDMSLVGPRPPVPEEVHRYERWQKRRLRMRPGLTCLWALMGRDKLDFQSWMRADIAYIDNWSLNLDWSILLRTIPHVLAGKGAH